MNTRPARPFGLLLSAWLAAAAAPAPVDPGALLDAATRQAIGLHATLGRRYAPLLHRSRGILIVPGTRQRGADAVLLLHDTGGWSEPAFFDAGSLNAGTPAILLLMTDRAVDTILRQQGLPQDGPDTLTVAPIQQPRSTDLLLWAATPRARLDQDGPTQDDTANTSFYGRPRGAAEIVGGTQPELRTSRLRGVLGG